MPKTLLLITTIMLSLPGVVLAIGGGDGRPDLKTPTESIKRWRSLRVGAFIHWTPLVLRGPDIPIERYDGLFKEFRAEEFSAKDWVRTINEAGLNYIVFTTKHGGPCCMWNTKATKYNVMNSPLGLDVVGELAKECKTQGVEFCPYYAFEISNHPDWTPKLNPINGEPDFTSRTSRQQTSHPMYGIPAGAPPDFERYISHVKTQLKELTDNYGPFLAWWFDSRFESMNHERGTELYAYVRGLQSDVLMSNRVDTPFDRGLDNPTWFVTEKRSAGDYAVSEISIPRFNREIPWEYCRLAQSDWFWKPNSDITPLTDWIKDIVNCACRDGNCLLGIGPGPDGKFDPLLEVQLRELGAWLEQNGKSIYGTRGGPFKPNSWYGSTCKGNKVYLHVFKTDDGTLTLPPINRRITNCSIMGSGRVNIRQTDKDITIIIDEYDIQETDTIIVLELDGSAEKIDPVEERILTDGASVHASNFSQNNAAFASDGDIKTYWTTEEGIEQGWLEYDLGRPCSFSRAILDEGEDGWIRNVQIQVRHGSDWKNIFEYRHGNPELWEKIPMELFSPEFRFDPVTAQHVRLNILKATRSPIVREFKLYCR